MAGRRLIDAGACLTGAVEIRVERQAGLLRGLHEDAGERMRVRRSHAERAAVAVESARQQIIVLGPLEVRQHVLARAALVTRPAIVVLTAAARENLRIDRAAAPENAPLRIDHGAPVDLPAGRRFIAPDQGTRGRFEEAGRHVDIGVGIARACLQQEHGDIAILAEARGDHATRGPAPDDDIVRHYSSQRAYRPRPGPRLSVA